MAFVLDCSVTLPWFLEDERTAFTDSLLFGAKRADYWVPSIWCLEFPNALLVAERRRRIERSHRIEALELIPRLQIRIDSEAIDLKSISEVAEKHELSTYDAAYLELALRRGLGLVTLDRDLAQAANSEGVSVQSAGRSGAAQRRRRYNA